MFKAAFRIPNLLSNLFGEGVLSAAFVTVYAKLRANGQDKEAEELAEAVFGVLATLSATLVLLGVFLAPLLIDVIAPGFKGENRALTIQLVRIMFPGAGLLVTSAWCLGVLNSHRRFLLSYTAPVAMNLVMIMALLFSGGAGPVPVVNYLAWAAVLGSGMQFLVQVPQVLQLLPNFRPRLELRSPHVRTVFKNFGPVFISRGVVQISATVDQIIGSFLGPLAISTLAYGQTIGVLPVSLFSMSISAAALPALSSATGTEEEIAASLRTQLISGLRRIAFFVVPSAIAFLLLGDVIADGLLASGRFRVEDGVAVWSVLAGSAVGLLATCLGRLYSSAFYALLDTKTPLRFAVVRVLLTTALGFLFALGIPHWLHLDVKWSMAALTASAGVAGWVEFSLLRRTLSERIGPISITSGFMVRLWIPAIVAGCLAYGIKAGLGLSHPRPFAAIILLVYAASYFAGTSFLNVEESDQFLHSAWSRLAPLVTSLRRIAK